MSARYPGDTQDALSIDDSPMPNWWNSPDIGVNAFGGAVADEGANTIHLRVHLGAGETFSDSQAEIEVFVGNPSLVMTPTSGTINLGTVLVAKTDFPAGGGSVETELPWNVTVDPADPGGIDQPGHRCLIARVYPFTSGKPSDFQVPTDQHEAQRNLCIVECADAGGAGGAGGGLIGAPGGEIQMGPGDDGLWGFMIDTTTPFEEQGELVTVRATRPLALDRATLKLVMPILERAGFRGFAAEPPPKFALELAEGGEPGTKRGAMTTRVSPLDRFVTRLPGLIREPLLKLPVFGRKTPRFELDVKLEPKRMARLALKADLRKTRRGQAHVFHIEQTGSKQQVQGGLTLVLVKVD